MGIKSIQLVWWLHAQGSRHYTGFSHLLCGAYYIYFSSRCPPCEHLLTELRAPIVMIEHIHIIGHIVCMLICRGPCIHLYTYRNVRPSRTINFEKHKVWSLYYLSINMTQPA
jgi:hypothetical protein